MLKIRLRRMGSRKAAFYRVVVSDSTLAPTGRFVEILGTYNPGTDPATVRLDTARADHWIRRGAHPSATVKRLLVSARAPSA